MNYFFAEDLFSIIASGLVFFFFLGYLIYRGQFSNGKLLLGLVFLLSLSGLSDMVFRFNSNANMVVLADGLNVVCYTLVLALILDYSTVYFFSNPLAMPWINFILIYLPPIFISAVYILTPWMVSGITQNKGIGFNLSYNSGYWVLLAYGAIMFLLSLAFVLIDLWRDPDSEDRSESLFTLFILVLLGYFYCSVIIFPFWLKMVNFASPLPTTFAGLALVYSYIVYGYFALNRK